MGVTAAIYQRLFFPPNRPPNTLIPPSVSFLNFSDLADPSIQHRVPYIHLRSQGTRSDGSTVCLIYSHGNGCDLEQILPELHSLRDHLPGVSIVGYDYIGYGSSLSIDGEEPSEEGCYGAISSVVSFCEKSELEGGLGFGRDRILLHGHSMGTGPTVEMVTRNDGDGDGETTLTPFLGAILDAPFLSAIRVVMNSGGIVQKVANLFDVFRNIDKIQRVNCPIYILHGTSDSVVPFEHGQTLAESVPQEKLYQFDAVKYADHGMVHFVWGSQKYFHELNRFIDFCLGISERDLDMMDDGDSDGDDDDIMSVDGE